MLEVGSLIDGKYKILSEIGRGGMSVVYMAINEKANKTWAIKEVRKDGVLDFESVRQGLIGETEMLKHFHHPNLPSIIDVIDQTDIFLIVMDYIEGVSLSKALSTYGIQRQEIVVDWAKQLCDVLGYLHTRSKPVIYRDMKPQNVMLKPDGNLVLIDFGTAREFKEKQIEDTTCLGTIGYAAPEQFGGQGQTDARTDIYCLGATLYHLITGMNPCEPPYEMRPIREANPKLSGGLEQIIIKCIQKDPNLRYQSCAELMYDLEHYEEIDDYYIRKQRKKLFGFVSAFTLSVIFLIMGICFNINTTNMTVDTYEEMVADAFKTTDYSEKIELYLECIELPNKEGDSTAYLGLISAYKENDSIFSKEEEEELTKLIETKEIEAALKKDYDEYIAVCFEVGKLYWYYYEDSETVQMKNSIKWFENVITYAQEDYENLGMAIAYAEIGAFYRDIQANIEEANTQGLFGPFYEDLNNLINTIAANEGEENIVRLEVLSLARSSIQQYIGMFKSNGLSADAMYELLDNIEVIVNTISTTPDKTEELKQEIIEQIEVTKKEIDQAYVEEQEEN